MDSLAALFGLTTGGLALVLGAAFVAGMVRGFTGFGTALVFIPVAAQVLDPVGALVTLLVLDLFGPLALARSALRTAHKADLARLLAGATLLLPLGVAALLALPPEGFRWGVSIVALGMLAVLVTGARYPRPLPPPALYATGGASGFLAGVTGLGGPPVILFYMASPHPVAVIRANTLLFLLALDMMMQVNFALRGVWTPGDVGLGLLAAGPALLGNLAGARLFDPARAGVYRMVAYILIGASALSGLPLFD